MSVHTYLSSRVCTMCMRLCACVRLHFMFVVCMDFVYVFPCICRHVYIRILVFMWYVCILVSMCMLILLYAYVSVCVHECTYVFYFQGVYHVYLCAFMCVYVLVYACIHISCEFELYVCFSMPLQTCLYAHTYIYVVCLHACVLIHLCTSLCAYVCTLQMS